MSQLQVKEVDFNDAVLLAAQTEDGKMWVGIRWVCEGIGLTLDQMRRQLKNIRDDLVTSKGGSNLTLSTSGCTQEVLMKIKKGETK